MTHLQNESKIQYFRLLKTIIALTFCVHAHAQISSQLYQQLPDSLRPTNREKLRIQEAEKILKRWHEFSEWDEKQQREADNLCLVFAHRYRELPGDVQKADFIHTLCNYLYFSTELAAESQKAGFWNGCIEEPWQARIGLNYSDIFIREIGASVKCNKQYLPNIYLYKAQFLKALGRHKDAYYMLLRSRDVAQARQLPAGVSTAYSALAFLLEVLGATEQALANYELAHRAIAYERATLPWFTGQRVYILYGKQRTFLAKYIKDRNAPLIDSVYKMHRNIKEFDRQYGGGMEAESHVALAGVKYFQKQYQASIAHVDSAFTIYPNLKGSGSVFENAIAFKALGLTGLGDIQKGVNLLQTIDISRIDSPLLFHILESLIDLNQKNGAYQVALDYHKQLLAYVKKKADMDLRGKSLEMEQFYQVKQKEAQISELKAATFRNFSIAVIATGFALLVAALAYFQNKVAKQERQKLISQLDKMTEIHSLQIDEAKEFERKQFAQDLHDDFSASIAASINYLSVKSAQESTTDSGGEALLLLNMLKNSYERVRKKSHAMYREDQTERFLKRIDDKVGILFFGTNTAVSLVSELDGLVLNLDAKATILAILKESITNIIKHAHATKVEIVLYVDAEMLILEISDNGMGIKKNSAGPSMGLVSMKKRVDFLQGKFEIKPNAPSGTIVVCKLPTATSGNFETGQTIFS